MVSLVEAPRPRLEQTPILMASAATAKNVVEDQTALFDTDEFRMYCYKVLPCAKRAAHEWTTCPWAHPGEKARRRDPRVYAYLAIPCPDTKEGKECPRGDDCPNCHSLFEYWLHPSRYRTQLCRNNDGSHCKRQICFFAHSVDELRVPDHSHLNIPDELLQQSSSAAVGGGGNTSPKTTTATADSSSVAHGSHKAHRDRRGGRGTAGKAPSRDAGAASPMDACGSPAPRTPNAAAPAGGSSSLSRGPSQPLPGADQHVLSGSLSVDVGVRGGGGNSSSSASALACMASGGLCGAGAEAAAAGMFSSAMAGDPEVPEPQLSPQRAAAMATAQQQLRQCDVIYDIRRACAGVTRLSELDVIGGP
ncbi:hypothetical protein COO60DRAFT_135613 [Scenedesmus sp. NREL 46B-D3]|nr:hypothetical protein COO60DRAFT_135613 [Scenedesmus sp. NREL 46B-D3]